MPHTLDARMAEQIQTDAVDRMWLAGATESNLSIRREVLSPGTTLDLQDRSLKIKRDTVLVFVDDQPLANWGHPCRYLLYEPKRGRLYSTLNASFPPDLRGGRQHATVPFHEPVVFPRPETWWHVKPFPSAPLVQSRNWYAVLFSGASNNRHTNDLEFLYRVLRQDYGVPADHIYVLNHDGTVNYFGDPRPVSTWPGDGSPYTMPVNAAGTRSELDSVLDELKGRLSEDDGLLIHTNNHGGGSEESTLVTYAGPSITASEFAAKLAELPTYRCLMVMMEQCYAGGFNASILASSTAQHSSVASAASATRSSIGGPDFDPFARDWISALHLATPAGAPLISNPDGNGDGCVTAREAYEYADAHHDWRDSPHFSASSLAARGCFLGMRLPVQLLPDLRVLIDEYWRDPGPLRAAFARIEEVLPSIVEVARPELEHASQTRSAIEALVKDALRRPD